ncbi:hypothetical protein JB92DRAFT_2838871 [Gautieria morchelliformis]|nr:hypothetical protein JB92DRAFT_2838871 [Gautieria morchelliformis]
MLPKRRTPCTAHSPGYGAHAAIQNFSTTAGGDAFDQVSACFLRASSELLIAPAPLRTPPRRRELLTALPTAPGPKVAGCRTVRSSCSGRLVAHLGRLAVGGGGGAGGGRFKNDGAAEDSFDEGFHASQLFRVTSPVRSVVRPGQARVQVPPGMSQTSNSGSVAARMNPIVHIMQASEHDGGCVGPCGELTQAHYCIKAHNAKPTTWIRGSGRQRPAGTTAPHGHMQIIDNQGDTQVPGAWTASKRSHVKN